MIDKNIKKAQLLSEQINRHQNALHQVELLIKNLQNVMTQKTNPYIFNIRTHKLDTFKRRAGVLKYRINIYKDKLKKIFKEYTPLTCDIKQLEKKKLSELL